MMECQYLMFFHHIFSRCRVYSNFIFQAEPYFVEAATKSLT